MTNYADGPAPLMTEADAPRRNKLPIPTNGYTVFLLLLILVALSVAFFDPKGIVLLVVVLAYAAHIRLQLTQRAEQRRTNELLEELLDDRSSSSPPLPHL